MQHVGKTVDDFRFVFDVIITKIIGNTYERIMYATTLIWTLLKRESQKFPGGRLLYLY